MSATTSKEGRNLGATGVPSRSTARDLGAAREQLRMWFTHHLPGASEVAVDEVTTPPSSGVANETLLCEVRWSGPERGAGRYVVRVASPTEYLYKDVDLGRHSAMARVLGSIPGIPVPAVVGHEDDPTVLGAPFFVMEHIDGQAPPDDPPYHSGGWVTERPVAARGAMWADAVAVLARLHAVDTARLGFLDRPELGVTGLEQDVRAWLDYGRWCARGRALPVPEAGAAWLVEHLPDDAPTGLAWGDARLGNLLFRDDRVVAVLDWDMVSLAGPESDLAWWAIMEHLYTSSAGVAPLEGIGDPVATVALWQDLAGREVRHLRYHCAFAAYRMSLILVRLADLLGAAGILPDDMAKEMVSANSGIQYLATMLDLPYAGPLTTPWPGLGDWA